ncbi:MAG: 2-isopropylmalate synthase [Synergistales bacterium]|nr:2-isopropylmalate synthase [Synergistales bacterium]
MQPDHVRIFDTTLRDGEQSAGINLNTAEKIQIAHHLANMKVDVIEAGFPAASQGDLDAVRSIAREVRGSTIAGLARTRSGDIEAAYEAVKEAEHPRIHTFIATSDIHMEHKLRLSREEVLAETRRAVAQAKSLVEDVEFSAEDASRSDPAFLVEVFKTAIEEGATTCNIPDTVGYSVPDEFAAFVRDIIDRVGAGDDVVWSVHCHNDLGLAVSNSLAGVQNGVRQVECTINGLGERAGNASLEEIVMALRTRKDQFGAETYLDTRKLYSASRLVSRLTGFIVPRNKAVVGLNAFAHEAGIHQHGVLCNKATYEIMTPEDVGAPGSELVLGKHSGKHAFRNEVEGLGYNLNDDQLKQAFKLFKALSDRKEIVTDGDLEALIVDDILAVEPERRFVLYDFNVHVSGHGKGTSTVTLWDGEKEISDAATGNGPIDASCEAIKRIIGLDPELMEWRMNAVSGKSDAVGEARVTLKQNGVQAGGRGASTDVVEASLKAYVNAVNRLYRLAAAKGVELHDAVHNG